MPAGHPTRRPDVARLDPVRPGARFLRRLHGEGDRRGVLHQRPQEGEGTRAFRVAPRVGAEPLPRRALHCIARGDGAHRLAADHEEHGRVDRRACQLVVSAREPHEQSTDPDRSSSVGGARRVGDGVVSVVCGTKLDGRMPAPPRSRTRTPRPRAGRHRRRSEERAHASTTRGSGGCGCRGQRSKSEPDSSMSTSVFGVCGSPELAGFGLLLGSPARARARPDRRRPRAPRCRTASRPTRGRRWVPRVPRLRWSRQARPARRRSCGVGVVATEVEQRAARRQPRGRLGRWSRQARPARRPSCSRRSASSTEVEQRAAG